MKITAGIRKAISRLDENAKRKNMDYFSNAKNVEDYIQMAEGFDGRELVDILRKHLKGGSTVLELGMGPGKDLKLLSEHFTVTGSDSSNIFIHCCPRYLCNGYLDKFFMRGIQSCVEILFSTPYF